MFSRCMGYHAGSYPSGCQKHCVFIVLVLRFGTFLQDPGVWEAGMQSDAYMQPDRSLHILGYVELDLPPICRLCELVEPAGSKGELPPADFRHRP